MARAKYMVDLAEEERVRLRTLLRRGKASVRMVARARVLLRAEEGYTDAAIAAVLDVGTATVGRIRKRFVERGLEQALREQPRPGQRRKLSGKQEAHVIAVACTTPPEGHGRWTLRLLAGKVVELGFAPSISPETVRQVLKKRAEALATGGVVYPNGDRRVRSSYGACPIDPLSAGLAKQ